MTLFKRKQVKITAKVLARLCEEAATLSESAKQARAVLDKALTKATPGHYLIEYPSSTRVLIVYERNTHGIEAKYCTLQPLIKETE